MKSLVSVYYRLRPRVAGDLGVTNPAVLAHGRKAAGFDARPSNYMPGYDSVSL